MPKTLKETALKEIDELLEMGFSMKCKSDISAFKHFFGHSDGVRLVNGKITLASDANDTIESIDEYMKRRSYETTKNGAIARLIRNYAFTTCLSGKKYIVFCSSENAQTIGKVEYDSDFASFHKLVTDVRLVEDGMWLRIRNDGFNMECDLQASRTFSEISQRFLSFLYFGAHVYMEGSSLYPNVINRYNNVLHYIYDPGRVKTNTTEIIPYGSPAINTLMKAIDAVGAKPHAFEGNYGDLELRDDRWTHVCLDDRMKHVCPFLETYAVLAKAHRSNIAELQSPAHSMSPSSSVLGENNKLYVLRYRLDDLEKAFGKDDFISSFFITAFTTPTTMNLPGGTGNVDLTEVSPAIELMHTSTINMLEYSVHVPGSWFHNMRTTACLAFNCSKAANKAGLEGDDYVSQVSLFGPVVPSLEPEIFVADWFTRGARGKDGKKPITSDSLFEMATKNPKDLSQHFTASVLRLAEPSEIVGDGINRFKRFATRFLHNAEYIRSVKAPRDENDAVVDALERTFNSVLEASRLSRMIANSAMLKQHVRLFPVRDENGSTDIEITFRAAMSGSEHDCALVKHLPPFATAALSGTFIGCVNVRQFRQYFKLVLSEGFVKSVVALSRTNRRGTSTFNETEWGKINPVFSQKDNAYLSDLACFSSHADVMTGGEQ